MADRTPLTSKIIEVAESLDAVYQLVMDNRWGDGLPVIPPTEDRVYAMLNGQPGNKVLGEMMPGGGQATLEKLAINAVMAGCLPDYFPVVVAASEAMMAPEFNLSGIQSTTNPVAILLIINGPIRKRINVNCGRGCMGPGWRANATIGRAIRLISINVGGALPGEVSKSLHGMPGRYTFCFGEDEEGSPWEPLHVERGFEKEQSAVTVVGVHGIHNVVCGNYPKASVFLKLAANSMCTMGNNNMMLGGGEPLLVLPSGHAEIAEKEGLSKAETKRVLFDFCKVPLSDFPPEVAFGDKREKRLLVVDGYVRPCRQAEDIMIVVAGAPNPYHMINMPTFGDTKAITRVIAESK